MRYKYKQKLMSGVMLLANEMLIKELIEYYNTITKGTNKSQ